MDTVIFANEVHLSNYFCFDLNRIWINFCSNGEEILGFKGIFDSAICGNVQFSQEILMLKMFDYK